MRTLTIDASIGRNPPVQGVRGLQSDTTRRTNIFLADRWGGGVLHGDLAHCPQLGHDTRVAEVAVEPFVLLVSFENRSRKSLRCTVLIASGKGISKRQSGNYQ